jgi:PhzF family phenazine biosynthesis protein
MTVEVLHYAAFTREGRGGNPAGVVLDAERLTDPQMLSIARAIDYSETAFVLPGEQDQRQLRVRYFSPKAEVAFCGHATIATAVALAERDGAGLRDLSTVAGPVRVGTVAGEDGVIATLTSPPARSTAMAGETAERLLTAMRWTRDDLDGRFPLHVGFAGNQHGILPVALPETLARFDYDYRALSLLMAEEGWTTVHAFWAEDPSTFHARNAFPPGGVVEDPATGAAAAAFGGYLRAVRGADLSGRLTILQGHHMGSPSRLLVDLDPGRETVRVSGAATLLGRSTQDDQDPR